MGYFAKLDVNNKVLTILRADNQDILNNGGEQSEQAAKHFEKTVPLNFPPAGVKYVQTSFNNNFRKRYAQVGGSYDANLNMFIEEKPYNSWILDSNGDWQAPIMKPDSSYKYNGYDVIYLRWIETDQKWTGFAHTNDPKLDVEVQWNNISSAWELL